MGDVPTSAGDAAGHVEELLWETLGLGEGASRFVVPDDLQKALRWLEQLHADGQLLDHEIGDAVDALHLIIRAKSGDVAALSATAEVLRGLGCLEPALLFLVDGYSWQVAFSIAAGLR